MKSKSNNRLSQVYLKSMFNPNLLGILINPHFIARRALAKSIRKNVAPLKGTILDFGCGSKPYKDFFSYSEYIGMDIEQSGHSHQNETIDVFYDGKKIPFSDKKFDVVFASEVFEHVFNLDIIIKEINRVLKHNSTLVASIPFVWEEHETPYDFARYTCYGIRHILENNGFEVSKIEKTTTDFETNVQLFINFVVQNLMPKNKYIFLILTPIFIMPMTLFGLILSKILPNTGSFYINIVLVAKKL